MEESPKGKGFHHIFNIDINIPDTARAQKN